MESYKELESYKATVAYRQSLVDQLFTIGSSDYRMTQCLLECVDNLDQIFAMIEQARLVRDGVK